ncbi:MAG: DMT family transporter [Mycobacteriaceae bacterium]|nr:DMT family transporter [Mycobacteriaceae bacterium]
MSQDAVVVLMALMSALCAAVGIVVRQRATMALTTDKAVDPTIATAVVRQPRWWAGTTAALAGYAFQAIALSRGSLLLVQPLLVSALLFALPLNAAWSHRRVRSGEWLWALLLTAALAVFVLVGQPHSGHYRPPVPAWALATAVLGTAVGICIAVANRAIGRARAMLLAAAVATLFGTVAVLTKISMHRLAVGGWPWLLSAPAPYLLVVLAVVATMLQQSAFHAGQLHASVPTMLVLEPVVAAVLGIVVLGEQLAVRGPGAVVLVLAVLVMIAATVALGRDCINCDESSASAPALPDETRSDPIKYG